jgi:DNA-binding NarL/FixJ family response regulator
MSLIQVALVEDHTLTRLGMRTALEQTQKVKVVGDAANAHDGLQLLQATKPEARYCDR